MIEIVKVVKSTPFILLLAVISISSKTSNDSIDYLHKILSNLEKIESASYMTSIESWQPGDTIAKSIFCRLIHEFNNPIDTTIGASFVSFDCDVPTRLDFAYDGKIGVSSNHAAKKIILNNFTIRPLPFRPITPPFFNYTKNIIKYALTTQDSINFELKEFEKYYYFKLVISEDRQVEFFGKAHYVPKSPYTNGTTSIYELWISKLDNLPYKLRREMSHQISIRTVSDVEINKLTIADFDINDYFPIDYKIEEYGKNNSEKNESILIGTKAPLWILNDKNEQNISLADFKGKVLLLQFTGIGCGPCQASIPLMKELKEKYSGDKFDLIAIETWAQKIHSLQNYSKRNQLNYNLLSGTDKVVKDYQTGGAVPVFFILDEKHIVKKVMNGYSVERTKKEIIEAIDELL